MWVGKFDFRKQLPLALQAIAMTDNPHIVLDVYGGGSDEQVAAANHLQTLWVLQKKWYGMVINRMML